MPVIEKLLKKENKLLAELKELNGEKARKGKIRKLTKKLEEIRRKLDQVTRKEDDKLAQIRAEQAVLLANDVLNSLGALGYEFFDSTSEEDIIASRSRISEFFKDDETRTILQKLLYKA